MKIQLLCMCYNSADLIKETLESYIPYIDRFVLFIDNKTTDNTYQIIKNFKKLCNKKVIINNFHFNGFANSRNECLDKSYDLSYEYTIFIDDSFVLISGEYLRKQLSELFYNNLINGISFKIRRNQTIYNSVRVIKTRSKIRFDGDIHEVFAVDEQYLLEGCFIDDLTCDNHKKRSTDRVYYDLEMLNGKTDSRSLYYISSCNIRLYIQGIITYKDAIKSILLRLMVKDTDYEERFLCYLNIGNIYLNEEYNDMAVVNYIKAAEEFSNRSGEAYLYVYFMTNDREYLKLAYMNRILGKSRLPVDYRYYGDDGFINLEYNKVINESGGRISD